MKLRLYEGLKESAKWMGFPLLVILGLFVASLLFLELSRYAMYLPPLLSLLGLIGFIKGFRS
jgi:hypothetical protein